MTQTPLGKDSKGVGRIKDYDLMILALYEDYRYNVEMGDWKRAELVWRAIEKLDDAPTTEQKVILPNYSSSSSGGEKYGAGI